MKIKFLRAAGFFLEVSFFWAENIRMKLFIFFPLVFRVLRLVFSKNFLMISFWIRLKNGTIYSRFSDDFNKEKRFRFYWRGIMISPWHFLVDKVLMSWLVVIWRTISRILLSVWILMVGSNFVLIFFSPAYPPKRTALEEKPRYCDCYSRMLMLDVVGPVSCALCMGRLPAPNWSTRTALMKTTPADALSHLDQTYHPHLSQPSNRSLDATLSGVSMDFEPSKQFNVPVKPR